ncbi:MAG: hypothetical protein KGL26_00735 [Pseudomonadota bacterium]|nr:hypothetical protein [Pseudomonadota bacterium]
MAADSAVTLIGGGTVVVRNERRKLFNLVPGQPIGLMFFGMAEIMGHPWDQLIDHYQKAVKPGHLPHVRDYAAGFAATLDHLEEFFPQNRQQDEYKRLLASVFRYVLQLAQFLRQSAKAGSVSDGAILETAIAEVWRDYQFLHDGTPRRDLGCFPEGFGQKVRKEHSGVIDDLIGYGFGNYGLSQQAQKQLQDIAIFCVVKDVFLEEVTGLVFAGFGAEDRYPVVTTWYVSAVVLGIVKRTEVSHDNIDSEIKSNIHLFADSQVTTAFIKGIDFNLERQVYGGVGVLMQMLVNQLVDAFPAEATARESVRARFQGEVVPHYVNAFQNMLTEYQQRTFIAPVLRVLEVATRGELGDTARELVSLNVFKKRITAQRETVGGAIDVAVISRDDGFQWWPKGT